MDGVYEVCNQGDYVYLACGDEGLRIINIADPQHILELTKLDYGNLMTVAVNGNYAYLGSSYGGIGILDISNPANPHEVRHIDIQGQQRAIRFCGQYAFVCMSQGSTGLAIIDISDPANAFVVNTENGIFESNEIVINGDTAYVAAVSQGLQVLDISNITAPVIIRNFDNGDGEWVNGVAVFENYAYLACGGDGFRVVDMTDMHMVTSIDSLYYAFRTSISGNFVYISYGDPECPLASIDITYPANPVVGDVYYPPENLFSFSISGDRIFVADYEHGLRVVDITDPFYMNEAFSFSRTGHDNDVLAVGDIAYVLEDYKLKAIDINSPSTPHEFDYFEMPWVCVDFAIQGNVAFVLSQSNVLYSIGISDPMSLEFVGTFLTPDDCHYSIALYDHYLYISENYGIRIIDISDPANMVQAGYFDTANPSRILTAYDHFLIYQQMDHSINVLDLIDPIYPNLLDYFPVDESCHDARFENDRLYLVSDNYMWIYDTNSWNELSVTNVEETTMGEGRALKVENGFVYLAGTSGLSVFDARNPSNPTVAGYYRTYGSTGLDLVNDLVILADIENLGFYDCSKAVGIEEPSKPPVPNTFELSQNYPNPFNGSTTIKYELPMAADVIVDIFDLTGRTVSIFNFKAQAAGSHSIIWDAKDVSSGVYFYKIQTNDYSESRKMILAK
jgi:hypothetical protein